MHTTAFIVTDHTLPEDTEEPSEDLLYQAAHQAAQYAHYGNSHAGQIEYETLSMGSRQYRFIQGEFRTNLEQFGTRQNGNWPVFSIQVMSQNRPDPPTPEGLREIPLEILRSCWNTCDNLAALALSNPRAHGLSREDLGLIYPQILIGMQGVLGHCLDDPDLDVFDQAPRVGYTDAQRLLPNESPSSAHHLACEPLRRLYRADFQVKYLKHLRWRGRQIVIEADWNL